MRAIRYATICLIVLTTTLLSGCGISPATSDKDMVQDYVGTQVFIVDQQLYHELAVGKIQKFVHGVTTVSVPITNRSHGSLSFQYRFYWFDKEGLEIMPEQSPWLENIMQNDEKSIIQQHVPNGLVQSYRLVLRLKPKIN